MAYLFLEQWQLMDSFRQTHCFEASSMQEYDSSAYRCTCKSGYSGASCNTASSPAKAPTTAPTANSSATPSGTYSCPVACDHGQCVEEFGSYVCACSPGYSGLSCTTASTPAGAPAPNGTCTWCQHGTCKPIANSQNEHYCECQTGYSNWDCATVSGRKLSLLARSDMASVALCPRASLTC